LRDLAEKYLTENQIISLVATRLELHAEQTKKPGCIIVSNEPTEKKEEWEKKENNKIKVKGEERGRRERGRRKRGTTQTKEKSCG